MVFGKEHAFQNRHLIAKLLSELNSWCVLPRIYFSSGRMRQITTIKHAFTFQEDMPESRHFRIKWGLRFRDIFTSAQVGTTCSSKISIVLIIEMQPGAATLLFCEWARPEADLYHDTSRA